MPSNGPIQWAEHPVQARRKRKDPAVWTSYKDIILQEFKRSRSIGHVRDYMKDNHGFEAELHQYKYQLYNKWVKDLSKEDLEASQEPLETEPNADRALTSLTQLSKPSSSPSVGTTELRSTIVLDSGTIIRCVHPQNSPKHDVGGLCRAKRSALSCSDEVTSKKKQRSVAGTSSERILPADDNTTVLSSNASQNSYLCSSCGSRGTPSTAGTSVVSRGEHVKSWLDTATEEKESLDPLAVDATLSLDKYKKNHMHKIRQAADLLMTMQCFDEAFQLYILVWRYVNNRTQKKKTQSSCFEAMKQSAMIACARSARGIKNLFISKKLLELELNASSSDSANEDVHYWKFLFHMLLADIYYKLGDSDIAAKHSKAGSELLPGFECLLSNVASGKLKIDLLTRSYLVPIYEYYEKCKFMAFGDFMRQDLGITDSVEVPEMNELVATALTVIPSETGHKIHGDMSMHDFLGWCLIHLNNASEVPAELAFLAPDSAVFYYLWRQMCEQPPGPLESRIKRLHTIMETPVAAAEVLYAFCTAFTTDVSEERDVRITRHERNAFSAAKRGAFKLKRLSNAELSAVIQTSFSQREDDCNNLQALSPISIVQRVLDLDITCHEPEKISRCIAKELRNTYANLSKQTVSGEPTELQLSSAYDPSIAPSNDSSSIASMRKMAKRIDQKGNLSTKENTLVSKPMSTTSRQSRGTMSSIISAVSQLTDQLSSVHFDTDAPSYPSNTSRCVKMEDVIDELFLRVKC